MEHEINVTIAEGETVTFVCKVGGNPEPRMVFFKDDKRLRSNENVTIGTYSRKNLDTNIFVFLKKVVNIAILKLRPVPNESPGNFTYYRGIL